MAVVRSHLCQYIQTVRCAENRKRIYDSCQTHLGMNPRKDRTKRSPLSGWPFSCRYVDAPHLPLLINGKPIKPYSGKLMVRVPPKMHAAVAQAAEVSGKSINQWIVDKLDQAAHSY